VILALNETRKTLIASRLQRGRSRRSKPATFESAIACGGGVWVEGCQQVDATGMAGAVDLLFLDSASRVVESFPELRPGTSTPEVPDAVSVLQLPAGTIRFSQTEKGDRVTVESVKAEPLRRSTRLPAPRDARRARPSRAAAGRGPSLL
jgi:uncharacterized protein